jgi:hypothetical protein
MTAPTGYPHALVGDPAPPPEQVDRRVLGMALKAHTRHLAAVGHELSTAAPWRLARSLDRLLAEANAAAPKRHTASDGGIGDARHQAENGPHGPGSGSDHDPWVICHGQGIVRAYDLTNDPSLNLPAVFERARLAARAGRLPQITGGGYLILNGRITAENYAGWHVYTGDPHVSHGHVSVSLAEAGFDSPAAWGVFSNERPTPARPAPRGDLTGHGAGLRGDAGDTGPRVAALQRFLRSRYPLYAKQLAVDGIWGPRTSAALAEFAHRSGIPEADGKNIGPKLAAALAHAGLDEQPRAAAEPAPPPAPARSAARDRVRAHLSRKPRP